MLLGGPTIVELVLEERVSVPRTAGSDRTLPGHRPRRKHPMPAHTTRIAEDVRPWRSTAPVAESQVEFLAALREARSD